MMRAKQSGSVNVEIDSAAQTDLGKTLDELRIQYETLVEKKRREVEQWYQTKVSQKDKFISFTKGKKC